MAGSVGNLAIVISGNAGPFAREVARVQNMAAGMVRSVGALGSKGAGGIGGLVKGGALVGGVTAAVAAGGLLKDGLSGVGAALAETAVSSVKLAADFKQASAQFEVMTGSAERAKTLLKDLQELAVATPFGSADMTKAAKTLLGFGVAADNVIPVIGRLSDVAAGDLENFNRMVLQFGQVMGSGQFKKEEFNVFAEAGADVGAFARALGTDMAGLFKAFEKGAVTADVMVRGFNEMTSAGGRFHNMNARMSQEVKGQWQGLTESVDVLKTKAGLAFLEGFKPGEVLDAASAKVAELTGKTGQLKDTFAEARKVFDAVAPSLLAAAGAGAMVAKDIGGTLLDVGKWDGAKDAVSKFAREAVVKFAEVSKAVTVLWMDVGILVGKLGELGDWGPLKRISKFAEKGEIDWLYGSPFGKNQFSVPKWFGYEGFEDNIRIPGFGGGQDAGGNKALAEMIKARERLGKLDAGGLAEKHFDGIEQLLAGRPGFRDAFGGNKDKPPIKAPDGSTVAPDTQRFLDDALKYTGSKFLDLAQNVKLANDAIKVNPGQADRINAFLGSKAKDLLGSSAGHEVRFAGANTAQSQETQSIVSAAIAGGSRKNNMDQVVELLKQIKEKANQELTEAKFNGQTLREILARGGEGVGF